MISVSSDYIIYVDESGDHSLAKINPEYPLFVLALCIVKKSEYADQIVPRDATAEASLVRTRSCRAA